jgi:hypothetical protein
MANVTTKFTRLEARTASTGDVIRIFAWGTFTAATFISIALVLAQAQASRAAQEPELPAILSRGKVEPAKTDDDLTRLLKTRNNESVDVTTEAYKNLMSGRGTSEEFFNSARRLLKAGLELNHGVKARLTFLVQMLEMAKNIESLTESRKAQLENRFNLEMHKVREFKLEIEIEVLKAQRAQ